MVVSTLLSMFGFLEVSYIHAGRLAFGCWMMWHGVHPTPPHLLDRACSKEKGKKAKYAEMCIMQIRKQITWNNEYKVKGTVYFW